MAAGDDFAARVLARIDKLEAEHAAHVEALYEARVGLSKAYADGDEDVIAAAKMIVERAEAALVYEMPHDHVVVRALYETLKGITS